jgi:hypothetical protein
MIAASTYLPRTISSTIAASSIHGTGAQKLVSALRSGCRAVSGISFGPDFSNRLRASSLLRPVEGGRFLSEDYGVIGIGIDFVSSRLSNTPVARNLQWKWQGCLDDSALSRLRLKFQPATEAGDALLHADQAKSLGPVRSEAEAVDGGWASGGGASEFFKKPSWQTGPGVPDDGKRDVPDVALTASFLYDPYLLVYRGALAYGGGTSASAPAFAGMPVLLNHYLVARGAQRKAGLGNLNQMLYALAQTSPEAFHDITSGNNMVECQVGSPDCTSEFIGYSAGAGFDLATGLGSVDLANLAGAALSRRLCCGRRPLPIEPCVSRGTWPSPPPL